MGGFRDFLVRKVGKKFIYNGITRGIFRGMGYDLFVKAYRKYPHELPEDVIVPDATYAPWKTDAGFQKIWKQVQDFTFVDIYRCYELWQLVSQVEDVEGDIMEVGVWRGGTGAILAAKAAGLKLRARIWLCDTFAGVAKAGGQDNYYKGGEHADTSPEIVQQLLHEKLKLENYQILTGIFPDESGKELTAEKIRLCHIDVDTYQSAKDAFLWAAPKVPAGGIIVFDDYGCTGTAGVIDFVNEQKHDPQWTFVHNLNGHGIFIRTARQA